ncbi:MULTISPECIES: tRNA dihydrouridine synthase [Clostridium]|uniref:tRNA-dihydrouridine synthase n=2 Tax=Clostridium TaxID=1485 RepID=D8GUM7_CLOLD|nr:MULTISPECIES: tRNA-dihydrouridine synthase family protein [Clostridium]ADK16904.1 putative tRNA-dihydrouridine synthase [Clostridium ljungdahlii DSM 13528]AGY75946.1 tRNA-dihydrouridine synthase family protein [Clostridium autoethanogenum DSM 10061]ALU36111.1 Diguanylate cyclase [Clostridium autoethanogenum DSM 10061]OAA85281.1 tRNA-dihydrouridine synthase C [Clostridium ljungdahlii DSM 13528]OVY51831.1 tRNA-dihydrouridine synthase C [Clostridium autoethanogenum]
MNFYFAPMEGLTGYIYRNAHNAFFNKIDKYFSPFIFANQSDKFKTKELNDILPENNQGIVLIPQLLTNNAKDFIHTSKKIKQMGYTEVNLNLGCPSGTVVSKNRGSGFLSKTKELDAFLDEIFSEAATKISVKTRIGKDSPEEFYNLIEIFNKYPIEELIIHPRIQKDFYKNKPNLKVFKDALSLSKNPICYNGDIFSVKDYKKFTTNFHSVETLMLGRGLLINPGLINDIKNNTKLDKKLLKNFHDKIYEDYKKVLFGDRNVLFRMKELWSYMIQIFSNNTKYAKKIKKSEKLYDYDAAVLSLFREQTILEN